MTWFVSRILIDASDTHVNYGMLYISYWIKKHFVVFIYNMVL